MKKSRIIGKRQIMLAVMVVALGAAVYLNWHFSKTSGVASYNFSDTAASSSANIGDAVFVNSPSDTPVNSSQSDDYFSTARNNRQKARDEALEIYKDITGNVKSDKDSVNSATEAAAALARNAEKEANIESLVKAKGFEECVAVINGSEINVIVKSEKLLQSDAVQIKDIAAGVTGFKTENIKIIEING